MAAAEDEGSCGELLRARCRLRQRCFRCAGAVYGVRACTVRVAWGIEIARGRTFQQARLDGEWWWGQHVWKNNFFCLTIASQEMGWEAGGERGVDPTQLSFAVWKEVVI